MQAGWYSGYRAGSAVMRLCAALTLILLVTVPLQAIAAQKQAVVISEIDINIFTKKHDFDFMLAHPITAGKISEQLGITSYTLSNHERGTLFKKKGIEILLTDYVTKGRGKFAYAFEYSVGMAGGLMAVNGRGKAAVISKIEAKGHTYLDLEIRLTPGEGMLDNVAPETALKYFFAGILEELLKEMEQLGDFMNSENQLVFKMTESMDAPFTKRERAIIKRHLGFQP